SYSLYLWHWPLLSMAKVWGFGAIPPLSSRVLIVFSSLLLAWLTYRFVETPVRKGARYSRYSSRTVIVAGLAICFFFWIPARGLRALEDLNPHPFAKSVSRLPLLRDVCPAYPGNIGDPRCTL